MAVVKVREREKGRQSEVVWLLFLRSVPGISLMRERMPAVRPGSTVLAEVLVLVPTERRHAGGEKEGTREKKCAREAGKRERMGMRDLKREITGDRVYG